MKPDAYTPVSQSPDTVETEYDQLSKEFVASVRTQLSTLSGEIAQRNKTVQQNDAYIYGDLLKQSLHVTPGHDFTPVNWLRRVVEIHRTETMGAGFTITSSYHGVDVDSAYDPNAKAQLNLVNNKKKTYAESRNKLIEAIKRDNGGDALWANMVENASAVGDSIIKAYYDENEGKYKLDLVEAVEHFYVIWNRDDFRKHDAVAFVYQVSKEYASSVYGVPDTVATSPLGHPLAILSSANSVQYLSSQPMVTIMDVSGKFQGWKSTNGRLSKCTVGQETELNAIVVGDKVYLLIDDPKKIPKFYIFPNKRTRRRPWGLADITDSAININQTYIETLSDWRTVASRVNFPKFKAFGFGLDTQLPTPSPRKVEMIGLGEGQDIVPIQMAANTASSELDFARQMAELKEAFVRETGISAQLFDMPDGPVVNSNQTSMAAMRSISDQVEARRQLWTPVIVDLFTDALHCLAQWDSDIKEIVEGDEDWYTTVTWPPALRKDDPAYQTMILNRFAMGMTSLQSLFEALGINAKEEIDRINDEMDNPITAAIHGKMLPMLAEFKIAGPPTSAPPKINVNLRGDLTPPQEGNLAEQHGFNSGPMYGPSMGPQGEEGIRATDNFVNGIGSSHPTVTGQGYSTGQPVIQGGQPIQQGGPQPGQGQAQPQAPQTITPSTGNTPGTQVTSAPGSGQPTPNSAQGNIHQQAQRKGRK